MLVGKERMAPLALWVHEIGAPRGIKSVEWRLLTNWAVAILQDVIELID
jgi:hypothetical protein